MGFKTSYNYKEATAFFPLFELPGDVLELLTPSGVKAVKAVPFLREKTGEMVDTLGVGGEIIAMQVDCDVSTGDILRGEVRNHRR